MMRFMAMATNKKAKDKAKGGAAGGARARRADSRQDADEEMDGPDRATPPLAEVDADAL